MINDLDKIKQHLNIEKEYVEDDQLLYDLHQASEDVVQHDLNRCLTDCEPEQIKLACLFLVATWYANREIIGLKSQELPKSYDYLINSFRQYQG